MRLNDVINRFTLVSGLEGTEVSKWTVLCVDAMQELLGQLLPGAEDSEAKGIRLSNAAGVLAYYKYCLYSNGGVKSFAAGSVSVTVSDDTVERARLMWEKERAAVSDLLVSSDGFCFRRAEI